MRDTYITRLAFSNGDFSREGIEGEIATRHKQEATEKLLLLDDFYWTRSGAASGFLISYGATTMILLVTLEKGALGAVIIAMSTTSFELVLIAIAINVTISTGAGLVGAIIGWVAGMYKDHKCALKEKESLLQAAYDAYAQESRNYTQARLASALETNATLRKDNVALRQANTSLLRATNATFFKEGERETPQPEAAANLGNTAGLEGYPYPT